jgi:branched-chain amino acid transport system substrate-binding protein
MRAGRARWAAAAVMGWGLAGAFWACRPAGAGSGGGDGAGAAAEVVVGVAWPWEARREILWGEGLQLAAEEINARGGILGRRLRLERFDDKESVDEGRMVAQRISAQPELVAVIGHLQSYVSVPAAAIYDLSGRVMIVPAATDPELTSRGYRRVFRVALTDPEIGRQLADFAAGRGLRRVAICYIRNDYGRGLANAFEERASEAGLTVAARQSYDPSERTTERSFEPTLREWSRLDLDAVFLAGEVPSAGLFVAGARAQGIRIPILGGDALSAPGLFGTAGAAAEGMFVASFFHPDEPRPEVRRFTEAFERRYGARPDAGAALGYDSVQVLARAMAAAGSTAPDQVAESLHRLEAHAGVTGLFSFDAKGDAVGKRLLIMAVRNGRFEFVPGSQGGGSGR